MPLRVDPFMKDSFVKGRPAGSHKSYLAERHGSIPIFVAFHYNCLVMAVLMMGHNTHLYGKKNKTFHSDPPLYLAFDALYTMLNFMLWLYTVASYCIVSFSFHTFSPRRISETCLYMRFVKIIIFFCLSFFFSGF